MTGRDLLVVDDDIDFAESLGDALRASGHQVTLAHSGEEGLERLRAHPFDLVLLDMRMPGMNGVETMAAMRRHKPDLSVFMVTAYKHDQLVQQAITAGARNVLHKPLSMPALLEAIAVLPA